MDLPARIPPHNLDAERAVLGAVLLEGVERAGVADRVLTALTAEDFFVDRHRVVFSAVKTLAEAGHAIDVLTLTDALREDGLLGDVGGPAALSLLEIEAAIPAHVDDYVRLILRDSGKRQQIQALTSALDHAWNGTGPAELASTTAEQLARIAERAEPDAAKEKSSGRATTRPLAEVIESTILDLRFGQPDLIPTPIPYLTERFGGGFRRGEYVVLGGGPGVAKTALALEWARYVAQPERGSSPVGIVSLEMLAEDLAARILVQSAQVHATDVRRYQVSLDGWARIDRISPQLAELPVWISDDAVSISQIHRLVRDADRAGQPLRLLIVDYLQLVQGPVSLADRRLEVRYISAMLKRIAKRYRLTVLALSSMTPSPTEKGKPQRPTMRNLRETRDIDHDADAIVLLWRPDPEKSEREMIIDKGRSGETGSTRLAFTSPYLTFQECL